MIKINLLDSVTERHSGAAVAVERKMSSPTSKLVLMSITVAVLLAAVVGYDVISSKMAFNKATDDLAKEQETAATLEAVMKEQKELEAKIANIDNRINAIKKLRDSQDRECPGPISPGCRTGGRPIDHQRQFAQRSYRYGIRPDPRVFKRPLL